MAGIEQTIADVREQELQLRRALEELPKAHRDLQVALATVAYEQIVETSPVRTGAYRAEHVGEIGEGDTPQSVFYEAPSRVGPDTPVRLDAGATLQAPSAGDFKAQADAIQPYQALQIANRRFYSGFIEFGTSHTPPRAVYGRAAASAEANAERSDIPLERLGIRS